MDLAALQHFTIQGELSCEALDNILNYAWIVFQRVRIECGHHASRTQIMDADHQALRALFKQLQAANEDLANKLFAPGKIQQSDLTPQVQHVMQLRQQLMEQGLKTALAIRAVLTPEQLAKTAQLKDRLQQLRTEMRTLLDGDQQ